MHLIVEMEQRPVGKRTGPNVPTKWGAFVRQGELRGSDLLKDRCLLDRAEAESAAKGKLDVELGPLPYTLEFR